MVIFPSSHTYKNWLYNCSIYFWIHSNLYEYAVVSVIDLHILDASYHIKWGRMLIDFCAIWTSNFTVAYLWFYVLESEFLMVLNPFQCGGYFHRKHKDAKGYEKNI